MMILRISWKMVKFYWETSKWQWLWTHGTEIIGSLLLFAQIWVMQVIFDGMAEVATQGRDIGDVFVPIAIFAGITMLRPLLEAVCNQGFVVMIYRTTRFLNKRVAEKAAKLAPLAFEDPLVLDELNKAKAAIPIAYVMGDALTNMLLYVVPYFIFLGFYLANLDARLIWTVALAVFPKILTMVVKTPLYAKLEDRSAPLRREATAHQQAMVGREFFKETRMLGVFSYFKSRYLETLRLLNTATWQTDSRSALFDLLMTLMTTAGYVGMIYLMFISLRAGYITVGVFAAVFSSVITMMVMLVNFIGNRFGFALKNVGRVAKLLEFFELPERGGTDTVLDWSGDIRLENVSFTYPNSENPSLRNLNLHIKAGETVALVGANGAGKSTLTKILMGIYEPTVGVVEVSGMSLASVSQSSRYKGISGIFQKFQKYQLTLRENIELGDIQGTGDVSEPLEQGGVLYPEDLDTVLSREFDGIDLSGGQWQRVAIARGLYRKHDLIVLDEPTAAIDPLEESRLYEKFAEIAKDKTALIVTHRLGSAKIADRIMVMEDGEIVESGSHQELLKQADGLYASMYKSQEQWYISP